MEAQKLDFGNAGSHSGELDQMFQTGALRGFDKGALPFHKALRKRC
jgi:hypothetical protein